MIPLVIILYAITVTIVVIDNVNIIKSMLRFSLFIVKLFIYLFVSYIYIIFNAS